MKNIRAFASSAEARTAGFTTLRWLRAFSFNEHAARIAQDRACAGISWWEVEALETWYDTAYAEVQESKQ